MRERRPPRPRSTYLLPVLVISCTVFETTIMMPLSLTCPKRRKVEDRHDTCAGTELGLRDAWNPVLVLLSL